MWPNRNPVPPSLRRVRSELRLNTTRLGSFPVARLAAVLRSPGLLAAAWMLATLASPVSAAPSGLRLVHAEEFSTAKDYDAAFWIAETGFFRNKEAQYYRPANVSVHGGALVLEGRREAVLNAAYDANGADWLTTTRSADYTSGSIVSRDAFTFGVFEVVARLPQGAGDWPAIWLVYEQGPPYREIDLVEAVGNAPGKTWTTIHAGRDQRSLKSWQAETPMPGLERDFHTYRLEWRKDSISIAIDGRDVFRMNPEEAHKDGIDPLRAPMHLRINLALGGSWGGRIDDAALPARVEVKSIKIWSVGPQTLTTSD
jgi:beta-glucanase (GH16 family)